MINYNTGIKKRIAVFLFISAIISFIISVSVLASGYVGSYLNKTTKNSIIDDEGKFVENVDSDAESADIEIAKFAATETVIAVLDKNGKLYMWGENAHFPADLPLLTDICAGQNQILGLDEKGKIYLLYSDTYNQLIIPDNLPPFAKITAQTFNFTGITKNGEVSCFGQWNMDNAKPSGMGKVKYVASGHWISAAVDGNDNICIWPEYYYPPLMQSKPVMVAAGRNTVIALGEDGIVYGNILNYFESRAYLKKPQMKDIVKIYAADGNAAAIDRSGKVYVWGEYSRVRSPGESVIDVPDNLPPVKDLQITPNSVIALGVDNKFYIWGLSGTYTLPSSLNGFGSLKPVFPDTKVSEIKEEIEVSDYKGFLYAISCTPKCKSIVIKADLTIAGTEIYIPDKVTLKISKGVKVRIDTPFFGVAGNIVSDGSLIIGGDIRFYEDGHFKGNIQSADDGKITIYKETSGVDEIERYLGDGYIYNCFCVIAKDKKLVIDRDLTIPKDKSLIFGYTDHVLVVNKGVTLNNLGTINTYMEPIIYGKVTGNKISVSH